MIQVGFYPLEVIATPLHIFEDMNIEICLRTLPFRNITSHWQFTGMAIQIFANLPKRGWGRGRLGAKVAWGVWFKQSRTARLLYNLIFLLLQLWSVFKFLPAAAETAFFIGS